MLPSEIRKALNHQVLVRNFIMKTANVREFSDSGPGKEVINKLVETVSMLFEQIVMSNMDDQRIMADYRANRELLLWIVERLEDDNKMRKDNEKNVGE